MKFSSVQSLDWLGCWGNMIDESAEILFQTFLQEAVGSRSVMGREKDEKDQKKKLAKKVNIVEMTKDRATKISEVTEMSCATTEVI